TYVADFDATNLPSGVYFYQVTAGNSSVTKKMMLLK
ncbi:MAG: T9SS type A sorting domain-containing protein, partial [Ignavibacteria bacterium]